MWCCVGPGQWSWLSQYALEKRQLAGVLIPLNHKGWKQSSIYLYKHTEPIECRIHMFLHNVSLMRDIERPVNRKDRTKEKYKSESCMLK